MSQTVQATEQHPPAATSAAKTSSLPGKEVATQPTYCQLMQPSPNIYLQPYGYFYATNNNDVPDEETWEMFFERLKEYKDKRRNTIVPAFYKADAALSKWAAWQSSIFRYTPKSRWSPAEKNHHERLQAIGFLRDNNVHPLSVASIEKLSEEERFRIMLERFLCFKAIHKTTTVPQEYQSDSDLVRWVQQQRNFFSKFDNPSEIQDSLHQEQHYLLDSNGFFECGFFRFTKMNHRIMNSSEKWLFMLTRLIKYKEKHGDCLVPSRYTYDPPLGKWVHLQRELYNKGQLRPDREAHLDAVGFRWTIRGPTKGDRRYDDNEWMKYFKMAAIVQQQKRVCYIEHLYQIDKHLGKWALHCYQLGHCRQSPHRKKLLSTIQLAWMDQGRVYAAGNNPLAPKKEDQKPISLPNYVVNKRKSPSDAENRTLVTPIKELLPKDNNADVGHQKKPTNSAKVGCQKKPITDVNKVAGEKKPTADVKVGGQKKPATDANAVPTKVTPYASPHPKDPKFKKINAAANQLSQQRSAVVFSRPIKRVLPTSNNVKTSKLSKLPLKKKARISLQISSGDKSDEEASSDEEFEQKESATEGESDEEYLYI